MYRRFFHARGEVQNLSRLRQWQRVWRGVMSALLLGMFVLLLAFQFVVPATDPPWSPSGNQLAIHQVMLVN